MADEFEEEGPVIVTQTGVLTSEFWLTVLGVIAMVALTVADKVSGEITTAAIAAACFGYQASRAVVKRAALSGETQVANFRTDLEVLARTPKPRAKRTSTG